MALSFMSTIDPGLMTPWRNCLVTMTTTQTAVRYRRRHLLRKLRPRKMGRFQRALVFLIRAMSWENLFLPYANNKGADQPAHLCSLISAFLVCCLGSIIPVVSISKISRLCSWTDRFESYLVKNPEDRFSHDVAHLLRIMSWNFKLAGILSSWSCCHY